MVQLMVLVLEYGFIGERKYSWHPWIMNYFNKWIIICILEASICLILANPEFLSPTQQQLIDCKECFGHGARGHKINPLCRHGCGSKREPVSHIAKSGTKDSVKTTRRVLVDCSECFGHGVKKGRNPQCRYGCGRVPKTSRPKTIAITPTDMNEKAGASTKDKDFISKLRYQAKSGFTWFAVVTVATTILSSSIILACLYKRKANKVKPFIRNIGRLT